MRVSSLVILVCIFSINVLSLCSNPYQEIIDNAVPPQELKCKLDELLQNEDIVQAFLVHENVMTNAERCKIAKKYKMAKIAWWNYVFTTPNIPGHILKLGPIHWTNSYGGSPVRAREVSNKNVSRVAYQQLIKKVIKEHSLHHVTVVEKYLYKVGKSDELNDRNYVVIAQDVSPVLLPFAQSIECFKHITHDQIAELQVIARNAYVADLTIHNCIFGKDGKIYIIDTEQTNKAKESDFFLKNPERMEQDVKKGLKHIAAYDKLNNSDYFQKIVEWQKYQDQGLLMGLEPHNQATMTDEYHNLILEIMKLNMEEL